MPKEIFVLGISTATRKFRPCVVFPICSHSNLQQHQNLIMDTVHATPSLLNVSTDGDSCQRKIFAQVMNVNMAIYDFPKHIIDFPFLDH